MRGSRGTHLVAGRLLVATTRALIATRLVKVAKDIRVLGSMLCATKAKFPSERRRGNGRHTNRHRSGEGDNCGCYYCCCCCCCCYCSCCCMEKRSRGATKREALYLDLRLRSSPRRFTCFPHTAMSCPDSIHSNLTVSRTIR